MFTCDFQGSFEKLLMGCLRVIFKAHLKS
jgi:hypothetical protein